MVILITCTMSLRLRLSTILGGTDKKNHCYCNCYPHIISIFTNTFIVIQAGTSWGESSKPDLFLNFILKVRMLRFSWHSRLKCRKSSLWENFWGLRTEYGGLRIEDWGLRTEDSLFTSYGWPHYHPLRPQKSSKGLNNLCHPGQDVEVQVVMAVYISSLVKRLVKAASSVCRAHQTQKTSMGWFLLLPSN